MAETQQGTYAQAVKSHPKSYTSNSNKQRSDKPESSSLNQLKTRTVSEIQRREKDGINGVDMYEVQHYVVVNIATAIL